MVWLNTELICLCLRRLQHLDPSLLLLERAQYCFLDKGVSLTIPEMIFPLSNITAEEPLGTLGLGPVLAGMVSSSGISLRMSSRSAELCCQPQMIWLPWAFAGSCVLKACDLAGGQEAREDVPVPRELLISLGRFKCTWPHPENHNEISPLSLKMHPLFGFTFN